MRQRTYTPAQPIIGARKTPDLRSLRARAGNPPARRCRCTAVQGSGLHWVVALPDWRERLTVRIAAHDLALAAHRLLGDQDEQTERTRLAVVDVLDNDDLDVADGEADVEWRAFDANVGRMAREMGNSTGAGPFPRLTRQTNGALEAPRSLPRPSALIASSRAGPVYNDSRMTEPLM